MKFLGRRPRRLGSEQFKDDNLDTKNTTNEEKGGQAKKISKLTYEFGTKQKSDKDGDVVDETTSGSLTGWFAPEVEEDSVYGLPKVRTSYKVKTKKKDEEETTDAEGDGGEASGDE